MLPSLFILIPLALSCCRAYEINLLSVLEDDPGKYNVELDWGVNYNEDAFKFGAHTKKVSLSFETASEIVTQIDAHSSFILVVSVKVALNKFGTIYSVTSYTGEVLFDIWVKGGQRPSLGVRYAPINSTDMDNFIFGPVPAFRRKRWNKIALHVYRLGSSQSGLDVYVNCRRIGRKITYSILDLFAYKRWFVTRRLDFRVGQKGYGTDVYSKFQGSIQDLGFVFKRDIKSFTKKGLCNILHNAKLNTITYRRALAEPIRQYGVESSVITELLNLVKDLRHDLTVQASEMKYVRQLIEGCEMCRVTNFCSMKPCYPGVHCYHAPKSKKGFYCGNCPFGSHGDGINCTDINECLVRPCSIVSKCINKSPGYTCEPCPEGFTGIIPTGIGLRHAAATKQVCSDIDECLIDNGGCDKLVQCRNTLGSFKCDPCPPGYEGDPRVECRFKQYCSPTNPKSNPCHKYAKCKPLNEGRDVACECHVGFAGDGYLCGYDRDSDGFPDKELNCTDKHCRKDNCPNVPNKDQIDKDKDSIGDICDSDMDNDGIENDKDNCRWVANPFQRDNDRDGIGNLCDNCPNIANIEQEDYDQDGIGDICDDDKDGDGVKNNIDNCPHDPNPEQTDTDGDGVGDHCDNCVHTRNAHQSDRDSDLLGDACDDDVDTDKDGIDDTFDNCITISNPDQADADFDGVGDACDEDDDNDSILDEADNCPLVANKEQRDTDATGIGDDCQDDWDGDRVPDIYDANKQNNKVKFTDFRTLEKVNLHTPGKESKSQWIVRQRGTHVLQTTSDEPALAVGHDRFAGVDFNGTLYVDSNYDDDYIGFVFSYQDSSNFYAVLWKKAEQVFWMEDPFRAVARSGLHLKRIKSSTGPGKQLRNGLWHTGTTKREAKLLWFDFNKKGWESRVRYQWHLIHRPQLGIMRIQFFKGNRPFADTGYIHDKKHVGGRLGFYTFSQTDVVWTSLSYRANDDIPRDYDPVKRRAYGK